MKKSVGALLLVSAVLASAGVFALVRLNRTPDDTAVRLVPAEAFVYTHVFLKPSVDQRKALKTLVERFDDAPDSDEILDPIFQAIDDALEKFDMTYEDNVNPWLGDQAAFFLSGITGGDPDGGLLLEADDEDAALDFLHRLAQANSAETSDASYEGEDFTMVAGGTAYGIIDGFLFAGSPRGLKMSIDVSHGEKDGLLDTEKFVALESKLTEDRMLTAFVDPEALIDTIEDDPAIGMTAEDLEPFRSVGALVAGISVTDRSGVFEMASEAGDSDGEGGSLSDLPKGAWLAFRYAEFGNQIRQLAGSLAGLGATTDTLGPFEEQFTEETGLDLEQDVLSWIGGVRLYVDGGIANLGGAVLIDTRDEATSNETISKLAALAERRGVEQVQRAPIDGRPTYVLPIPGAPQPLVVVAGSPVVVAFGAESAVEAVEGSSTLDDNESFIAASDLLGDDFEPAFFLDLDVVEAIVSLMFGSDFELVGPWLEPLTQVIAGSKLDGDVQVFKLVIGVE